MLPIFNKTKEQDIPSFNQLKKEEKELPQAVEIKMVESSEEGRNKQGDRQNSDAERSKEKSNEKH